MPKSANDHAILPSSAAIVAIGSELLCGQVTNRNAAWLAERLFAIGIDSRWHLTVDDIEADILDALTEAAKRTKLILVTGGLGPTSDDLTRQAVARWAGMPLTYDDASWTHIVTTFNRLGTTPPEANRQQCYFPTGARVLVNRAGTANGFAIHAHGCDLWVLPGPPREVEAIWSDHARSALESRVPETARRLLRKWRMVGRGESHLAEQVTPLLAKAPSGLEVAYRAHAPYVELKLRVPLARASEYGELFRAIDQALTPWIYERDDQDTTRELARHLAASAGPVALFDGATEGHIAEAMLPAIRAELVQHQAPPNVHVATTWNRGIQEPEQRLAEVLAREPEKPLSLAVVGFDGNGRWAAGIRRGQVVHSSTFEAPYAGKGLKEAMRIRSQRAAAAWAQKYWLEHISL